MGITALPTRAFVDVATRGNYHLQLQGNDITTIDAEAFSGIDIKGNLYVKITFVSFTITAQKSQYPPGNHHASHL